MPSWRDKLKKLQRGTEISVASFLRLRLFSPFGPDALPVAIDFKRINFNGTEYDTTKS